MKWHSPQLSLPNYMYLRCEVRTNRGNRFKADYYKQSGYFIDDQNVKYGWEDNESEIIIKWKEL